MKTLVSGLVLSALGTAAQAQSLEVIGYAGVLGEWELAATIKQSETRAGEFSGPATLTHVGVCSQDGPEQKTGDIRVRMSSSRSRLDATLSLAGVECSYSASLSDAYKGEISCPDRPPQPLRLWLR